MDAQNGPGKEKDFDDLDIELTVTEETPDKPVGEPVHTVLDASALNLMLDHAASDTSRELGGFLIGTHTEGENPTVRVEAMIPARYADGTRASLTFTHKTWQDVYAIKDRVYPDKQIVGWFHTHPGLSVFLSNYDLHIHENFFKLNWQVAYVIDPIAGTEGFFRWENGKVRKTLDYEVVGRIPTPAGPVAPTVAQVKPVHWALDWRTYALVALLLISAMLFRNNQIIVVNTQSVLDQNQELSAQIAHLTELVASEPETPEEQIAPIAEEEPVKPDQLLADDGKPVGGEEAGKNEDEGTIPEVINNIYDILPLPEDCFEYEVQLDDRLWDICYKYYPNREFMRLILYANDDLISIDDIDEGSILKLPGARIQEQREEEIE